MRVAGKERRILPVSHYGIAGLPRRIRGFTEIPVTRNTPDIVPNMYVEIVIHKKVSSVRETQGVGDACSQPDC